MGSTKGIYFIHSYDLPRVLVSNSQNTVRGLSAASASESELLIQHPGGSQEDLLEMGAVRPSFISVSISISTLHQVRHLTSGDRNHASGAMH